VELSASGRLTLCTLSYRIFSRERSRHISRDSRVKFILEEALTDLPKLSSILTRKASRLFETRRYCFRYSIDDRIAIGDGDGRMEIMRNQVDQDPCDAPG
jgi:hypothetical protein